MYLRDKGKKVILFEKYELEFFEAQGPIYFPTACLIIRAYFSVNGPEAYVTFA